MQAKRPKNCKILVTDFIVLFVLCRCFFISEFNLCFYKCVKEDFAKQY